MDLSNEVLNIDFGQETTKIQEVKVGGKKKYLPISLVRTHAPGAGRVSRYFFQPLTLTSDIFAALNQCLVLHLKDPLHICLEAEVQGYGMTFKVCNFGSKKPYFNSSYVVRVPLSSFRIVPKGPFFVGSST